MNADVDGEGSLRPKTSSLLLFWLQEEEAIALVEAMLDANALELLVQVHQSLRSRTAAA